ncbi:LPS export ABC transporter periplasmic protein LptC [Mucilaginibacter pallidiroseus]|nr:LPS export ABC transporter periplasmic protein LptC [Mucilaginibacter pallidiroseus]
MGKYTRLYLPAILSSALLLGACENDLNKVRAVTAADATKAITITKNVRITYSDSAYVKAVLTAPVRYEYAKKPPVDQMPNGVKIIFYNKNLTVGGDVIADSCTRYEDKNLVVFRHNVIATNTEGVKYRSEELIWNSKTKEVYSNQSVVMTKPDGQQMTGTKFTSQELRNPRFENATAIVHMDNSVAE